MTDLTHNPQSSMPAKPTTSGLSAGLKSLLQVGERNSAIRELVRSPAMLAECRMALPMLRQEAKTPAGIEGVTRVVSERFANFPPRAMSDSEWAAWWQPYYDQLSEIPEPALRAGMGAWMRDPKSEFMPQAGKLRALALGSPNYAATAYERAQAAIAASTPNPPVTRADREQVQRMMAEYRPKVAIAETRKPLPPTPVETDEAGLSPMMRARMG